MKEQKTYRATPKLLDAIAKSKFTPDAPMKITRYVAYYQCLIDINSDWTADLSVDDDCIKNNPDYFEEIH